MGRTGEGGGANPASMTSSPAGVPDVRLPGLVHGRSSSDCCRYRSPQAGARSGPRDEAGGSPPFPQFFEYNETPLFLQLSRQAVTKDLPVTIYESIVEIVNGEPEVVFVKAAYEVETGEAERVAVDHASKPSTTGSGTQSSCALKFTSF